MENVSDEKWKMYQMYTNEISLARNGQFTQKKLKPGSPLIDTKEICWSTDARGLYFMCNISVMECRPNCSSTDYKKCSRVHGVFGQTAFGAGQIRLGTTNQIALFGLGNAR